MVTAWSDDRQWHVLWWFHRTQRHRALLTNFTSPSCAGGAVACCSTPTNWATSDSLCISGTIPGLTTCPTNCSSTETVADYAEDWGAMVGVYATPAGANGGTVGQSFSTIAVSYGGTPGGTVRLVLTDSTGTEYCKDGYTSGTTLTASSLVTNCWGASPENPLADFSSVAAVQLQIDASAAAETFTNFCVTGITLATVPPVQPHKLPAGRTVVPLVRRATQQPAMHNAEQQRNWRSHVHRNAANQPFSARSRIYQEFSATNCASGSTITSDFVYICPGGRILAAGYVNNLPTSCAVATRQRRHPCRTARTWSGAFQRSTRL